MTAHPKPKTVRDPAWLQVVRQMPCWCYGKGHHELCTDTIGTGPSECSHLDGKSRDDRVLPMCGLAHRTSRWSWHAGQQSFCREYGVTKAQMIREAEALYRVWKESQ